MKVRGQGVVAGQIVTNGEAVRPTRLRRKPFYLFLFAVLSVVFYMSNLQEMPSYDVFANSILPFAILQHHGLFLESYLSETLRTGYFVRPYHHHLISTYPIGAGLTVIPVYALYLLFGHSITLTVELVVGKFSASIVAAVSAILVYQTLEVLGIRLGYRILFLFLYAFGSETFGISSQGMWEHGPAELWLAVFLLLTAKLYRDRTLPLWQSLVAGLAIGMLLLTRPQDMVMIVPFLVLLLSKSRRKHVLLAAPVALACLGVYEYINLHFYKEPTLRGGAGQIASLMSAPFGIGLAGNTISPSRGLFIFSPWALWALGWITKVRQRSFWTSIYAPALVAFVIYIVMYSKLGYWTAGSTYGPRYMTDVLPILTVLSAGLLEQMTSRRSWRLLTRRALLVVFSVWSIGVQVLGAYVNGTQWNRAVMPDYFSTGIWSVQYGEIAYYAKTLLAQVRPPATLRGAQAKFDAVDLYTTASPYSTPTPVSTFAPGVTYPGTVVMTNTGTNTWSAYLAHGSTAAIQTTVWQGGHQIHVSGGIQPLFGVLLHDVRSGQTLPVHFYFATPTKPGTYQFRIALVPLSRWAKPPRQGDPHTEVTIHVVQPSVVG